MSPSPRVPLPPPPPLAIVRHLHAFLADLVQFSLDAYVDLFNASIECSRTGEEEGVADRCDVINKYHTRSVYEYTCRGLFERHKLLFSLQVMTAAIADAAAFSTAGHSRRGCCRRFFRGGDDVHIVVCCCCCMRAGSFGWILTMERTQPCIPAGKDLSFQPLQRRYCCLSRATGIARSVRL